jgi:hypothetical protein
MGQSQNKEAEKRKEEIKKAIKANEDENLRMRRKVEWLMDLPLEELNKELILKLFEITEDTPSDKVDEYKTRIEGENNKYKKYMSGYCIKDIICCIISFGCGGEMIRGEGEVCGCNRSGSCYECRTFRERKTKVLELLGEVIEKQRKREAYLEDRKEVVKFAESAEKNGVQGL